MPGQLESKTAAHGEPTFLPLRSPINSAIRRVMLAAIDRVECMTAAMGINPSLFSTPVGFFLPGTPSAIDAGMAAVLTYRRSCTRLTQTRHINISLCLTTTLPSRARAW